VSTGAGHTIGATKGRSVSEIDHDEWCHGVGGGLKYIIILIVVL